MCASRADPRCRRTCARAIRRTRTIHHSGSSSSAASAAERAFRSSWTRSSRSLTSAVSSSAPPPTRTRPHGCTGAWSSWRMSSISAISTGATCRGVSSGHRARSAGPQRGLPASRVRGDRLRARGRRDAGGQHPDRLTNGLDAMFVDPGDSVGLAVVLRELAESPERLAELATNARLTLAPVFVDSDPVAQFNRYCAAPCSEALTNHRSPPPCPSLRLRERRQPRILRAMRIAHRSEALGTRSSAHAQRDTTVRSTPTCTRERRCSQPRRPRTAYP